MVRICFVCLGNICRSPTAEGVMRSFIMSAGLREHIEVDSAGTSAYHVGEAPDSRATQAARERGIDLVGASRQFIGEDFLRFDYILAADRTNYEDLCRAASTGEQRKRVHLLRSFDSESADNASVPDPYYGGVSGFDDVLDICESACRGLLDHLRSENGWSS